VIAIPLIRTSRTSATRTIAMETTSYPTEYFQVLHFFFSAHIPVEFGTQGEETYANAMVNEYAAEKQILAFVNRDCSNSFLVPVFDYPSLYILLFAIICIQLLFWITFRSVGSESYGEDSTSRFLVKHNITFF
jgi:hypothetical protein